VAEKRGRQSIRKQAAREKVISNAQQRAAIPHLPSDESDDPDWPAIEDDMDSPANVNRGIARMRRQASKKSKYYNSAQGREEREAQELRARLFRQLSLLREDQRQQISNSLPRMLSMSFVFRRIPSRNRSSVGVGDRRFQNLYSVGKGIPLKYYGYYSLYVTRGSQKVNEGICGGISGIHFRTILKLLKDTSNPNQPQPEFAESPYYHTTN
jgi:hypothetical protein